MTYEFRPAVRDSVWLLLGLSGPSGSGKTFSGMRVAAGLSGDKPFAVIDTEAGRAKHYADWFKFDHCDVQPPFTPETYLDAICAAEKAGYGVILVDSMSHEWAGEGGILDLQEKELDRMAGDDWKKRDACKMAAWIRPKGSHKKMMARLLQLRAHLVLCFRADSKIEIVKKDGKLVIQPKQTLTGLDGWVPICEKSLPYELTASFLLTPDAPGVPKPIKLQEQHKPFFPLDKPITEESGRQLAAWARGNTTGSPQPPAYFQIDEAAAGDPIDERTMSRLYEFGKNAGLDPNRVKAICKDAGFKTSSSIRYRDLNTLAGRIVEAGHGV